MTTPSARRLPTLVLFGLVTVAGTAGLVWFLFTLDAGPSRLAGSSYDGAPGALSTADARVRDALRADVARLAERIGERNTRRPRELARAAEHVEDRLTELGLSVERQSYEASGSEVDNLFADVARARGRQLLVGAHYDSAVGSPGGNDNATGVAVLLELAARFRERQPSRWMRFVFFVNEEPPHFRTDTMGSRVYAARAAASGELPTEVVVLDSVGFYSEAEGSQRFPLPRLRRLFGHTGDFVAFVGDRASGDLLSRIGRAFRSRAKLPSEGAVFPRQLAGAAWSDHASFWAHDIPAILVSDTATFRDPHYHQRSDTGAQVDYEALVRLVTGLEAALRAE